MSGLALSIISMTPAENRLVHFNLDMVLLDLNKVCLCTSVTRDDWLGSSQVAAVEEADSIWELVVLTILL